MNHTSETKGAENSFSGQNSQNIDELMIKFLILQILFI